MALITVVPAVLSGASQMMPLIQREGFKTPKAQTALAHAVLNDAVAIMLAYNWWTRRSAAGFVPSFVNLILSGVLALPIVFLAASMGGDLVYSYGMGVRRSSRAKKSQ
ncbi:hypothetical protein BJ875DRAFT_480953 [Amylocarpus encephaloides]|uniref:DUF2231 domain-containing protein n=1 Tax=Amylocarpus encephaloides TaxID=45428 RepID=A0A9P8C8H5_9HELO|nr:hypothetical protein BJ875DRAFT_480953 [Amylocarpus encephaloides]